MRRPNEIQGTRYTAFCCYRCASARQANICCAKLCVSITSEMSGTFANSESACRASAWTTLRSALRASPRFESATT
eukprot:1417570-Pleurochrysis_carterae.AAC.2